MDSEVAGATRTHAAPANPRLAPVAWVALFLAPVGIYWRLFKGSPIPTWAAVAGLVVLVAYVGAAFRAESARPLRTFLATVVALGAGSLALLFIERTTVWTEWAARTSYPKVIFADSALEAIPCLLMAAVLLASGLRRRDMYVDVGNLRASAGLPFTERRISWSWLGIVGTILFAGPLALQLTTTVHPDIRTAGWALAALPAALAFGAFNAAQEEFRFRAGFLATLVPAVGSRQAVLMTSALFGFAHWYGHPSGPVGVGMAFLAGFVLARSMLETRGSGWAWFMHAVQDVVIFAFLVMAAH